MTIISIVIPVYNLEKYIERCVRSIQQQSFIEWELILVDDNSSDSSLRIIKELAANDVRIKYLKNDVNYGPMIAREKGYQLAQGQYITFIDGDDTLPINSLRVLYEEAVRSQADIIVGDIIVKDAQQNEKRFKEITEYGIFTLKEYLPLLLKGILPHNLCAKLFKAELFRNKNYKNEIGFTNGEDGLLFYQILEHVSLISIINETVYYYWMHSTSSSHRLIVTEIIMRGMIAQEKCRCEFVERVYGYLDDQYIKAAYESVAYNSAIYPPRKVLNLYRKAGLDVDVSFYNLKKYFKGEELIKIYIKCHLLFYYNYVKSLFLGNRMR